MAKVNEIASALTEGMLATATNLLLFSIFWVGSSVGKRGSLGAARAFEEAFEALGEVNYVSIKRAFYSLSEKGYVTHQRGGGSGMVVITEEGYKYLRSLLPKYRKEREWDRQLYLVTYDIPEEDRKVRDFLRKFLRRISCGMLQKSVWITPYDPRESISSFIKERGGTETVIVSKFGDEGNIAGKDPKVIMQQIFPLKRINAQYKKFIEFMSRKTEYNAGDYLSYLAILKEDPQLPRELLPGDWLGDEAYEIATAMKGFREKSNE